jgi:hypothetical protein
VAAGSVPDGVLGALEGVTDALAPGEIAPSGGIAVTEGGVTAGSAGATSAACVTPGRTSERGAAAGPIAAADSAAAVLASAGASPGSLLPHITTASTTATAVAPAERSATAAVMRRPGDRWRFEGSGSTVEAVPLAVIASVMTVPRGPLAGAPVGGWRAGSGGACGAASIAPPWLRAWRIAFCMARAFGQRRSGSNARATSMMPATIAGRSGRTLATGGAGSVMAASRRSWSVSA